MIGLYEKQKKRRNKIKYTIHGFNQIEALKMGLSTDDLTVLRWFIDYKATDKMERTYIEKANDIGFWVDYSTLIDALPILLSDGNMYLQRFIELEKLIESGNIEEYEIKRKKFYSTERKKIQRLLSGPLSQILKKDSLKKGIEKGTKIFLYIDRENYSKLLLNTNMETYLAENEINIEKTDNVDNVDNKNTGDKSVPSTGDKNVPSTGDKNVPSTGDKNVPSDSSIIYSSISYSSINNSSIIQSNEDRVDLSFYYKLSYEKKIEYLMNKFDVSDTDMQNILTIVDMGVEEGTIKSKVGSCGYWKYIYKIFADRHKKRLIDSETINKSV